jgi:hypothetical protein
VPLWATVPKSHQLRNQAAEQAAEQKLSTLNSQLSTNMILIPFHKDKFAAEMKPLVSGNNLTLNYDNIESSLAKVIIDIKKLLGSIVDTLIQEFFDETTDDMQKSAIEYLQRALLHFTMYEHIIFLITRVGNDGVTVKKNDDETTVFKYQQDQLENQYISLGWFWINYLIQLMNENPNDFPDWTNSPQKTDLDELPVDLSDFERWVGLTVGGEYFMINVSWIIREVWKDCILSRFDKPVKNNTIARAVCYEVMARACERLAYSCLPEPIRKDIDNEMGKNHRAEADKVIRNRISLIFFEKAQAYWNDLDLELKQKDIDEQKATPETPPVLGRQNIYPDDSFFIV